MFKGSLLPVQFHCPPTVYPNPSPKPFNQSKEIVNFDLDKSQVRSWYDCVRDIRRSHCQPSCACVLLSGSEHRLAPSWARENWLVKIFCLLCVCFWNQRVINSKNPTWTNILGAQVAFLEVVTVATLYPLNYRMFHWNNCPWRTTLEMVTGQPQSCWPCPDPSISGLASGLFGPDLAPK
jgi:hypothetical protein